MLSIFRRPEGTETHDKREDYAKITLWACTFVLYAVSSQRHCSGGRCVRRERQQRLCWPTCLHCSEECSDDGRGSRTQRLEPADVGNDRRPGWGGLGGGVFPQR